MFTQLEQELTSSKRDLQAVIEEMEEGNEDLRSANEEILSSNEELQSTNEELETAKEELQATNEELTTVNDELQNRNVDLNRANSDLLNLLVSINMPIVLLGRDLRIRRFTSLAERVLNVISTDVGRPIGDLTLRIQLPDLERFLLEAIETVSVREQEVQDPDGRWYSMQIRPYKATEDKIDGAVLMLVDIDALKRSQDLTDTLDTIREPFLILDTDLRVKSANRSFYQMFQVRREQTEGRLIYDLGNGQWDIPELRSLLEHILPEHTMFDDFEVEQTFPRIGRKLMLLNGRQIYREGKRPEGILLAIEDITERAGSR
jgi:two-component system CheB/CheR fusion protein